MRKQGASGTLGLKIGRGKVKPIRRGLDFISVPDDQPIISCLHNRLIILYYCRLVYGSEIY